MSDNKIITKWVYHTEGGNVCDKCKANAGREFKTLDKAPKLPIHPNCRCWLEEIYSEQDLTDLEKALGDVLNSQDDLKQGEIELNNIKSNNNIQPFHIRMVDKVLEHTSKWDNVIGDFTKEFYDLKHGNRTDDKGAHHDANEVASSRGVISGEIIARMINWSHEIVTGVSYVVFEGKDVIEVIQDAFEDMDANEQGIRDGRKNRK